MKDYFKSIFQWLESCEMVFGFDLKGYSKTRIYAFLLKDIFHFGSINIQNQ